MKKNKLLTPIIIGAVGLSTAMTLVGCSTNNASHISLTQDQKSKNLLADESTYYYFTLDKDTYVDKDMKVTLSGKNVEDLTYSFVVSNNFLVLNVKCSTPYDSEAVYWFDVTVKHVDWQQTIPNIKLTISNDSIGKQIQQINTIVQNNPQTTMSGVVDILDKNNIELENLTTNNAKQQWVWDSKNNVVFIMNADGSVARQPHGSTISSKKSDIWKMVKANTRLLNSTANDDVLIDEFSSTTPYSQYLRSNQVFDDELQFCSGLDTGKHENLVLEFVQDSTGQVTEPVTINTYGSNLTIDAPVDSVVHYGSLLNLNIKQLDGQYVENGTIAGEAKISDGSFVVEPTSTVNTILVDSKYVSIEVKDSEEASPTVGTITRTDNVRSLDDIEINIPESLQEEIEEDDTAHEPVEEGELSGLGTEASPYIVTCKEDFVKIHEYYSKGYKYYKFASTTKEIDGSNWETNSFFGNLCGSFDGNGLLINHLSRPLFNIVGLADVASDTNTYKISNLTLNCEISTVNSTSGLVRSLTKNAKFENIEIHGYISGSNYVGSFVGFGPGNIVDPTPYYPVNWEFNNCHSDASLTSTGTSNDSWAAGFIGYHYSKTDESVFKFIDSYFDGTISCSAPLPQEGGASKAYGYFTSGTLWDSIHVYTEYTSKTTEKLGGLTPEELGFYSLPNQKEDGWFYVGNTAPSGKEQYNAAEGYIYANHKTYITTTTATEPASKAQTVSVPKCADATSATAALFISPNDQTEHGSYLNVFLSEDLDIDQETLTTDVVKNYKVRVNEPGITEQGVHGDTYDVYDGGQFYGRTYSSARIIITQYKTMNGVEVPFHVTTIELSK